MVPGALFHRVNFLSAAPMCVKHLGRYSGILRGTSNEPGGWPSTLGRGWFFVAAG